MFTVTSSSCSSSLLPLVLVVVVVVVVVAVVVAVVNVFVLANWQDLAITVPERDDLLFLGMKWNWPLGSNGILFESLIAGRLLNFVEMS